MSKSLKAFFMAFMLIAASGVFLMGNQWDTVKSARAGESFTSTDSKVTQEQLRELLLERKRILEKRVENMKVFFNAGRVSGSEYAKAKEAALLAGLDLCHTKAERVTIRREIVGIYQEAEGWTKRRADTGHAPQSELDEARVACLEAEINLIKEQLDK
ncbi:MAG: hypothetical protein JXM79_11160 [Sedimentisphaerales bacterium]|nr:hypothetical protein [Sedimentisphaerales bacterium]